MTTLLNLQNSISKTFLFIMILFSFAGCKDNSITPIDHLITGNYELCYQKFINNHWEIFINNITGTNPQNISNYYDDDEYPQWSPDGRYIVYSRSQPVGGLLIIVYDTKTQTSKDISDGGGADLQPHWTPNSKVFFGYSSSSKYQGTYLMNPDGSDRKKILDTTATIYFYNDSYNFLYVLEHTKVYKTNIDNTVNEFLFDIGQTMSQQIVIQGFSPITEELLISPTDTEGMQTIATYSIITRSVHILLTAEQGYTFFQMKYSMDFSKIVFIEHSSNDEYLSVFENGNNRRLVRIPASSPVVYFSYEPMEFSPDGKYIAFSEQIFHSGQWISFSTPLLIVNVSDGIVHRLEDEAHYPSWNPQL